jgi:hypothetical protein
MWKKTFIRLAFVMVVATMGLMVLAAANKRSIQTARECTNTVEKCPSVDKSQADFTIFESLSRSVFSTVQY